MRSVNGVVDSVTSLKFMSTEVRTLCVTCAQLSHSMKMKIRCGVTGETVATTRARKDGRCQDCKTMILKGNTIFKVAKEGATTREGNGPGRWVCSPCGWKYPFSDRMHEWVESKL